MKTKLLKLANAIQNDEELYEAANIIASSCSHKELQDALKAYIWMLQPQYKDKYVKAYNLLSQAFVQSIC